MVAGRPSPTPLGPVYPAGSALGGGWGLLWPYRTRVVRWGVHAVEALPQVDELIDAKQFATTMGVGIGGVIV